MNRSERSRLGELQSEGNLGNERNRNSEGGHSSEGQRRERVRNRSGEDFMPDFKRPSRMERSSGEEWSSGDSDSSVSRSDRSSS